MGARGTAWRRTAAAVLAVLALASLAAVGAQASTKPPNVALAKRLAAEDPGAVLGGDTIVATGSGAWLFGVPHRPNFIFALGPNEVVFGGEGRNEIRALAANVTIYGGRGSNYVWAGQGATVFGGTGSDTLIDTGSRATLWVKSRHTEVVMYGRDGRVRCTRGARGALIYVAASDTVGRTCRAVHARVVPVARLHGARPTGIGGPGVVTGDGSNGNPFVAPCSDPGAVDCTVNFFPLRALKGWPDNQNVPAYRCPDDHPYLVTTPYAPFGWTLGPGVQVQEDWGDNPISVSITGYSHVDDHGDPTVGSILFTGTLTGFPNSSATNWNIFGHWYKVVLHCTSNRCHGAAFHNLDGDANQGAPPDNCTGTRIAAKPAERAFTELAATPVLASRGPGARIPRREGLPVTPG